MKKKPDIGLEYLQRIHFKRYKYLEDAERELDKIYGRGEGNSIMEDLFAAEGEPTLYDIKNTDINISTIISGLYDSDIIRHFANYLYAHKDIICGDILEIGCESGIMTGFLAMYFPEVKITAIDRSPKAVEIARLRLKQWNIKNVEFRVADIFNITDKYDTVISLRTAHENYDDDNYIFIGDALPDLMRTYREQFQPYAAAVSRVIKEDGHLISIERMTASPLPYGWIAALNDNGCAFNLGSFQYMYPVEGVSTAHLTAFTADKKGPVDENIPIQFMLDSMLHTQNTVSSTAGNRFYGWNAIAYFELHKGECLADSLIIDPTGDKVGRFAAYLDRDDPNTIVNLAVINTVDNTGLGTLSIKEKDRILSDIEEQRQWHHSHGFKIESFPAKSE